MRELADKEILEVIRRALYEDIGAGDITSESLFPKKKTVQAVILAKEEGLLAGIVVAMATFVMRDSKIKFMPLARDGQWVETEQQVAYIEGNADAILSAERTALNFLSHLSGVATLTAKFVEAIKPYKTRILDTRKTTPGLRILEKYAVAAGGGANHRMGLYDQILVKDNHLTGVDSQWSIVHRVIKKAQKDGIKTEIEVKNLKEFKEAMKIRPDIIMLDNMGLVDIRTAVSLRSKNKELRTKLEVSGGITLKNAKRIAATGVDMISIGALTHSVKAIDFSLEIIR